MVNQIDHSGNDPINFTKIENLPDELIVEILVRIQPSALDCLSLVCQTWRSIIFSRSFWRRKLKFMDTSLPDRVWNNQRLTWRFFYHISCNGDPFEKNLLINSSGQLETRTRGLGNRNEEDFDENWFNSWWILSSGGQGWIVLDTDGTIPTQVDEKSLFATSCFSCSKEQVISLAMLGDLIDKVQPNIRVEEWYSTSPGDHGAVYEMESSLLDSCQQIIVGDQGYRYKYTYRDDMKSGQEWRLVTYTFSDYGANVRSIRFYHAGMAEDMEPGWNGARMTGARVILEYPFFWS